VGILGCAENVLRFDLLIVGVLFLYRQEGQNTFPRCGLLYQGYLLPDLNGISQFFGDGQRHGDRPR